MNKERVARTLPGIPVSLILIALLIATVGGFVWYLVNLIGSAQPFEWSSLAPFVVLIVLLVVELIAFNGLTPVNPNEAPPDYVFQRPVSPWAESDWWH